MGVSTRRPETELLWPRQSAAKNVAQQTDTNFLSFHMSFIRRRWPNKLGDAPITQLNKINFDSNDSPSFNSLGTPFTWLALNLFIFCCWTLFFAEIINAAPFVCAFPFCPAEKVKRRRHDKKMCSGILIKRKKRG